MFHRFPILLLIISITVSSCAKIRGHYGGKHSFDPVARKVAAEDIAVPQGYTIEPVASGLTYPTAVCFDEPGNMYVLEAGYSYGEIWTQPRLLQIAKDGSKKQIAAGDTNGPWTAVSYHNGNFYISEGGTLKGGKILKVSKEGKITELVTDLPSKGDHHTNGALVGPDGYVYFGQGVATNSGIVGEDNYEFGWLKREPKVHDIPCEDLILKGKNFPSDNPLTEDKGDKAITGAFAPFGTPGSISQVVKGQLPCNGAIMRVPMDGGKLELVAWGLRNPFGLAFSPDGKLYATNNSYDVRGSRPVYGTGDELWEIRQGSWYGWPDFSAGEPLNTKDYKTNKKDPEFIIEKHPNTPPKPAAILGVHASANGLDFSRSDSFGYKGDVFIAEFGDMAPNVGRIYNPVGFKVVRVNPKTGVVEPFAENKGDRYGPASRNDHGGLERPVAVKFSNDGSEMYIVDFGVLFMTEGGPAPKKETGVIWRVRKKG